MKTIISTLAVGLVLLSSCGTNKDLQQPEYRDIRNVRLVKASLLQTTAGVDLVYYNPNSFSLQLSNAKGDVYIDNSFFGRFELDDKVVVRKNAEFTIPVVFKLDNIGAIKNQWDLYKRKEALVRIEGIARVKKSGFVKDIPIKFERMQNIEQFRTLVAK